MCSCLGSSSAVANEPKRQKRLQEETMSCSVSTQLKDATVRVVHAGGRIEMYRNPLPAYTLIQRYPGMCIAWPDVFNRPHESLLSADDILLPGNKYYVIRSTAVEKLKRRRTRKVRINERGCIDESMLMSDETEDISSEESMYSAKDFYVSRVSWSNLGSRKYVKEKRKFVPPIARPKLRRKPEWEPGLTSIQELSP